MKAEFINSVETSFVKIFMAGDYERAKDICQRYCSDVGLCVTVTPTSYVYKYGREEGFIAELINYPRFPETQASLSGLAMTLADLLLYELDQGSYTIMNPLTTNFYSRREGDKKK